MSYKLMSQLLAKKMQLLPQVTFNQLVLGPVSVDKFSNGFPD